MGRDPQTGRNVAALYEKTKPVFRSLFWKLLLEILSLCLGGLLKYSNIYKTKLMFKNSPGTLYDEPRVEKMLC